MPAEQIAQSVPGLYTIPLGMVNAFFIDDPHGSLLIDTGFSGNADKILTALKALGKQPNDIKYLLLTHNHSDHIGNAAALRKATGARTYMHPLDAPITEAGTGFRPMSPAPGLKNRLLTAFLNFWIVTLKMHVEPCPIDERIEDGATLPLGITAIHIPGHCLGQLAFHWPRHGGVLFAADSCDNMPKLDYSIAYENIEEGKRSLRKLAALDFEIACFGHGKAITQNADQQFRERWAAPE